MTYLYILLNVVKLVSIQTVDVYLVNINKIQILILIFLFLEVLIQLHQMNVFVNQIPTHVNLILVYLTILIKIYFL